MYIGHDSGTTPTYTQSDISIIIHTKILHGIFGDFLSFQKIPESYKTLGVLGSPGYKVEVSGCLVSLADWLIVGRLALLFNVGPIGYKT